MNKYRVDLSVVGTLSLLYYYIRGNYRVATIMVKNKLRIPQSIAYYIITVVSIIQIQNCCIFSDTANQL